MFFIIQNILVKIVAGTLFVVTMLFGGLAGLLGALVRSQMPNVETLTDSPVKVEADSMRAPTFTRMAVVTAPKSDKKRTPR